MSLLSGDREFFFELLLLIEISVVATQREQLLMRAELDDVSAHQNCNLVGVTNCRDAMRNQ